MSVSSRGQAGSVVVGFGSGRWSAAAAPPGGVVLYRSVVSFLPMPDDDESSALTLTISRLNRQGFNLGLYPHAFQDAAERLTRIAIEGDQEHILFAPAIYLYQQAFELWLKKALRKARVPAKRDHSVDRLWTSLREKLHERDYDFFGFEGGPESARRVQELVDLLRDTDPRTTLFRFADVGDGNIAVLGEAFVRLTDALHDGCELMYAVCESLDALSEAQDYDDGGDAGYDGD